MGACGGYMEEDILNDEPLLQQAIKLIDDNIGIGENLQTTITWLIKEAERTGYSIDAISYALVMTSSETFLMFHTTAIDKTMDMIPSILAALGVAAAK